jgi:hypothetical protein
LQVNSKSDKPDSDKSAEVLYRDGFKLACQDLGRNTDEDSLDDIFQAQDNSGIKSISFEEFKSAIRRRTKLEQWSLSIPTSDLVASCLAPIVQRKNSGSSPDTIPNLSAVDQDDQLSKILDISGRDLDFVCMGIAEGCKYVLQQRTKILKVAYAKLDEQKKALELEQIKLDEHFKEKKNARPTEMAESKFSFCMTGGNISDFYKGLEARIGMICPIAYLYCRHLTEHF